MQEDTVNAEAVEQLIPELVQLIIEALNLELSPGEVDPDAPLYGEGMGLDSIDMLEIALVISKRYGFPMRSDSENNQKIFASPRALAAHITRQRTT
ncbi:MAG: acyl carrier protein [Comamonadaceae bacterium]|jgi:acyl carrier protein|uniref:Acyl carrier protein n=1 Tax=Hydrogenophaga borbori TaxID=2294117 RepID=A0A372EN82_9BURK|nr:MULTISPECIES: phosphopantetheine-binding protein [Hydrogenophaga]NCT96358.1 acyl carrier protein [Comamonadaceae bacterium]RFP81119.1 acyl carrier protein [Hydrogenophaga borbori]WQB85669.1 phosphopantetheine-binding protein [Hydrogenophaga sp. SNF1]